MAYLKAHQISTTHLDVRVVSGEANEHGVRGVRFYVVATAGLEEAIVCWARLAHTTISSGRLPLRGGLISRSRPDGRGKDQNTGVEGLERGKSTDGIERARTVPVR